MRNTFILNTWWTKIIWILFCVAVSFWGFAFLQGWGDVWKDEAYQTWSILNWESSRVAPLSYWVGYKWMSIFGFKVVNLRLLATIIGSLAVTTSVIYSYYRTKNLILCGFLLMLGTWVWRADAFMLYNWDSGSYLLDCMALICIVEYFRRPTLNKAVFCGVTCALMTLGRLPSGILGPLMCVLMCCYGWRNDIPYRKTLLNICVFVAVFIVVFICLLTLMYGNPVEYINSLNQGKIGGHSLNDLGNYKWRMYILLENFTFIFSPAIFCILLPLLFRKRLSVLLNEKVFESRLKEWLIISCLCLFIVIEAIWTAKLYLVSLPEGILGCTVPIVVALLLLCPVRNYSNPDKPKMKIPEWELWGCAVTVLASIFGSDSYVGRIEGGFFLPIIIAVLWILGRGVKEYLSVVVVLWLLCCIGINVMHWIIQTRECIYEYTDEIGLYSGIKSSVDFDKIIEDLKPAISLIKKNHEKYILIDDRNVIGMVLGPDDGPGYHDFEFFSEYPENWRRRHIDMLDRIDAVVYSKDFVKNKISAQKVVEMLRGYGYVYSQETDGAVIVRKVNK